MDIIELARELGAKIQEDERYLKFKIASQINDEDENLQNLIKEFNLKRINVSNELSKSNHDDEKIKTLNEEMQKCYNEIMKNKNMINYNQAKSEFDMLVKQINNIIMKSAEGEDPWNDDIEKTACSGDCQGCAGCY